MQPSLRTRGALVLDRRVVVRRDPSRARIEDDAFVLRAVGIPFEIRRDGEMHALVVPATEMARALDELDSNDAEEWADAEAELEQERHARETDTPARARGWPSAVVYIALIAAIYLFDLTHVVSVDLGRTGVADAGRICDGEWWRTVTALCLHVDAGHVIGNAAVGGLFLALLCRTAGNGVAWALFLASGAIGNGVNALLQDPSHLSVGASTAVFGTLGALAAWQWSVDTGVRLRRTRRFAPIVMSIVLLTYLGAGGERTDVLAHVTGFLAGCGLGRLVAPPLSRRALGAVPQRALLSAVAALVAASWLLAFRA